jgi:hypothetical protein
MRAWWWLMLAACATTPVTVRMAHEGEQLPKPAGPETAVAMPVPEPEGTVLIHVPSCRFEGTAVPAVRAAVIAYARTQLLSSMDRRGGYRSEDTPIETPMANICEQPSHAPGRVTTIMLEGGAPDGMLEIAQAEIADGRCQRGVAAYYCVYVDGTTVIVQPYNYIP